MDSRVKTMGYMDCRPDFLEVSILVLMDSRVKTIARNARARSNQSVSILVLMDSRVKTLHRFLRPFLIEGFNPCFNG